MPGSSRPCSESDRVALAQRMLWTRSPRPYRYIGQTGQSDQQRLLDSIPPRHRKWPNRTSGYGGLSLRQGRSSACIEAEQRTGSLGGELREFGEFEGYGESKEFRYRFSLLEPRACFRKPAASNKTYCRANKALSLWIILGELSHIR